jgi:hypothetical protein
MSMMWVTPARTTSIIFSSVHIPPPTPSRGITQVMSMPLAAAQLALPPCESFLFGLADLRETLHAISNPVSFYRFY